MPIKRVGRVSGRGDKRTRRALQRTMLEDVSGIDVLRGVDSIASAATCSIGLLTADLITITGTVTITSFGEAKEGTQRDVVFADALTLTYNATSMILPLLASITTAAKDTASFRSDGQGNWQCISYILFATGLPLGVVPITKGGTGQTTAVAGKDALTVQSTDIASATPALSAATGEAVRITGATTITAFGTVSAGAKRVLTFAGALTLTHNATSLILPTAANITTAAGDVAVMLSLGSGNWKCASYTLANGQPIAVVALTKGGHGQTTAVAGNDALSVQGVDIAGATTTDLSAATGGYVNITGTGAVINSFGTVAAGVLRTLKFTGGLNTLTYNATSMILPGSANVLTSVNDVAIFRSLGSGNWQCVSYVRGDGTPVGKPLNGVALQVNSSSYITNPGLLTFDPVNNRYAALKLPMMMGWLDRARCEHRLSLSSTLPVTTVDQIDKGTIYLLPNRSGADWLWLSLYDSPSEFWTMLPCGTPSLSLTLTSGKNYDVYAEIRQTGTLADITSGTYTNSTSHGLTTGDLVYIQTTADVHGGIAVVTSTPTATTFTTNDFSGSSTASGSVLSVKLGVTAWTDDTNRAVALTTKDGVVVFNGELGRRYLGTIRASDTNKTEDSNSKGFVWNYYNQVERALSAYDAATSWNPPLTTMQQANGNSANKIELVNGMLGGIISISINIMVVSPGEVVVGVGVNSTSVMSGLAIDLLGAGGTASYVGPPRLGYSAFNWLEFEVAASTVYNDLSALGAGYPDARGGMNAVWKA